MAKFKKTKFEFRNIVLYAGGRYLLLAGNYKEQEDVMRLTKNTADDAGLGKPYLLLTLTDDAFRYLAKEIHPDVDNMPLNYGGIVLYAGEHSDG